MILFIKFLEKFFIIYGIYPHNLSKVLIYEPTQDGFHEPSLNIIKKLALALCGTSEKALIFFYIINPWIMIAIAIFVAKLIQHIMPRPYRILTGGR